MPEPSLLPDIPEEIRACRIGSCVNSLTRSLMPYAVTFDPQKLRGAKRLRFVDGKGVFACLANSSSSASANSSFFGLDIQARARFWGCTASAGFNMALASKSTTSSQAINCFVSYTYQGQSMHLLSASPEILYRCMTEDFQDCYDAIMKAETIEEYVARYNEFTQKYGHGCVTALHLTAGSAFRIEINYENSAQAASHRYGASLAVNTPVGGGSAAAEWGNEVSTAATAAKMSVIGQDIPQDAPTSAWCREMVDKFTNKGISTLAQSAETLQAPMVGAPQAPSLPETVEPDKRAKPEPRVTGHEVSEKLQEELMKEDGYTDWAEYVDEQKKAYEQLTAKNVVEDAQKASQQVSAGDAVDEILQPRAADLSAAAQPDGIIGDIWDLGGFIPYAYEVTPWSELFPALRFRLPQTFSSIYLARIYTFYLTRLQFGRYLYFLSDVGPDLAENTGILNDAHFYASYCDALRLDIALSPPANRDQYLKLVIAFEERLRDHRFHSKAAYETFFGMYSLFADSPYGYIPVQCATSTHYLAPALRTPMMPSFDLVTARDAPSPFSITPMLSDALRFYPVLTPNTLSDKRLKLVCVLRGSWQAVSPLDLGPPLTLQTDDHGYQYLGQPTVPDRIAIQRGGRRVEFPSYRLYFAGFGDVPPASATRVRGLPMFDELPFDDMREFARPASESS